MDSEQNNGYQNDGYQNNGYYNGGYQNNGYYNGSYQNNGKRNYTLGLTSMVLGILSVVFICCCYSITPVLGIASIVLGIISIKKNEDNKGFAIAGIITGIMGIVLAVVTIVAFIYLKESGIYDELLRRLYENTGELPENWRSYIID